MGNLNQVGKKLGKTKKESAHNIRRAAENFPAPERGVRDFNPLFTYEKSFAASPNAQVSIDVKLKEITTPCSINPPTSSIYCVARFDRAPGPTFMPEILTQNTNLIIPTGDFVLSGGNITVPVDGCYGITWTSAANGVSYFNDKSITAQFLHNGHVTDNSVVRRYVGVIHTLGPWVWVYSAITHIYVVIEAKAGDTLSSVLSENGMDQCRGWYGTCLRGYFNQAGTQIRIDLVAQAENA